jgi:hypothetical protein
MALRRDAEQILTVFRNPAKLGVFSIKDGALVSSLGGVRSSLSRRLSFGAPLQRRRVLRNLIAGRSSDPFLASCYRDFEGPNDKPCSADIRRLRARRV